MYPAINLCNWKTLLYVGVWKCWSASKFLSLKIMSHSSNPQLWLGAKGSWRMSATTAKAQQISIRRREERWGKTLAVFQENKVRNCSSQSAMVPLHWAIDLLPPVLASHGILVALCPSCGTAEWKNNRRRTSDSNVWRLAKGDKNTKPSLFVTVLLGRSGTATRTLKRSSAKRRDF